MTVTEAIACGMVVLVGLGSALVILAAFIVRQDKANPWFCPLCGEDYPCPVHGSEIE